ncbi:MAG: hypothetical protein ACTH73_14105, partial [Glutamicibacter ardleyensis]
MHHRPVKIPVLAQDVLVFGQRCDRPALKWLNSQPKWPTFKRFNGLQKLDETQIHQRGPGGPAGPRTRASR